MYKMFKAAHINIIPSSLFNQTILDNIDDRTCFEMFAFSNVITIQDGLTIPKNIIELQGMFQTCDDLTYIPSTLFDIQYISSLTIDCTRMFESCNTDGTDVITIKSGFAIPPNVVSMYGMFSKSGIDKIPSSLFNQTVLDNINNRTCYEMFYSCNKLTTIQDGFTIPKNVMNIADMFNHCTSLISAPSTLFSYDHIILDSAEQCNMFKNCTSLMHVDFNLPSSISNTNSMFYNCTSLNSIPSTFFDNVVQLEQTVSMFENCYILDLTPNILLWDQPKLLIPSCVINSDRMFYNCGQLFGNGWSPSYPAPIIEFPENFSQCISMFQNAHIVQINSIIFNNIGYDCSRMFYNCNSLVFIQNIIWNNNQTDNSLDGINATQMFMDCRALTRITNFKLPNNSDCTSMFEMSIGEYINYFEMNIEDIIPQNFNNTTLTRCFFNCNNLSGTAQPSAFWENPSISSQVQDSESGNSGANNCFANCVSLDNYAEIPYTWGGLKPNINTNTLEINLDGSNNSDSISSDYFAILNVDYNLTPSLEHTISAKIVSSELQCNIQILDSETDIQYIKISLATIKQIHDGNYPLQLIIYVYDSFGNFSENIYNLTLNIINSPYKYIQSTNITMFGVTPTEYTYEPNFDDPNTDPEAYAYAEYQITGSFENNTSSGYILWGDQQQGVQPQIFTGDSKYSSFSLTHKYTSINTIEYAVKITGNIVSLDLTNGQNLSGWITSVSSLPCTLESAQKLFKDCINLNTLNEDTFILPSGLTDCTDMFNNCTLLAADISNIFNLWNNPDNYKHRTVIGMFYNDSSINGYIQPDYLWNSSNDTFTYYNDTDTTTVFGNCISLTNYNEIPTEWRWSNTINIEFKYVILILNPLRN